MKYDYDGFRVYDDNEILNAIKERSLIADIDIFNNYDLINEFIGYCEHSERYCGRANIISNDYLQLRDNLFCSGLIFNANCRALSEYPELKYSVQYSEQVGYWGGNVHLLITTMNIDTVKCIVECIRACSDYPILSDDIYYGMESELIEDTVNDFIQYNPEYTNRRDDIREYLYNNGSEIDCSWDYSEHDLVKYLAS